MLAVNINVTFKKILIVILSIYHMLTSLLAFPVKIMNTFQKFYQGICEWLQIAS